MQKSIVFLLFTVFSTFVFADNTEDYAQSRPKSSVKINTVTETVTTTGKRKIRKKSCSRRKKLYR